MKNEFLEALGSNNANNNTDLSLYSRFVGNWSFTMTTYDEEGKIEDTKAVSYTHLRAHETSV